MTIKKLKYTIKDNTTHHDKEEFVNKKSTLTDEDIPKHWLAEDANMLLHTINDILNNLVLKGYATYTPINQEYTLVDALSKQYFADELNKEVQKLNTSISKNSNEWLTDKYADISNFGNLAPDYTVVKYNINADGTNNDEGFVFLVKTPSGLQEFRTWSEVVAYVTAQINTVKQLITDLDNNKQDKLTTSQLEVINANAFTDKDKADLALAASKVAFIPHYDTEQDRDAAIPSPILGQQAFVGTSGNWLLTIYEELAGGSNGWVDSFTSQHTTNVDDTSWKTTKQDTLTAQQIANMNANHSLYQTKADAASEALLKQNILTNDQLAVVNGKVYTEAEKNKLASLPDTIPADDTSWKTDKQDNLITEDVVITFNTGKTKTIKGITALTGGSGTGTTNGGTP